MICCKQEAALSVLLPRAARAGSFADWHTPTLSLTVAELSGVLCAKPNSRQPLPNTLQGQCFPGIMARTLGKVVLQLPASISAGPGITRPLPLAAGPFLGEVTQRQGTLAQACPEPLPTDFCLCPACPSCCLSPRVLTPNFVAL